MIESDFYLVVAEVSGVFIGFGALIGATRKHSAVITILLRTLVVAGLAVLVGALTPGLLVIFGVEEPFLWRISCAVLLLLELASIIFSTDRMLIKTAKAHAAENRGFNIFQTVLEIMIFASLMTSILGFMQAHWQALFTIALVVNLVQAGVCLAKMMFTAAIDE